MEAHLLTTGIDTLKVSVKRLAPDGKPARVQELSEGLAVLFQAWQEKARDNGKPLATSMTFHEAGMTMLLNGAQAWKYLIKNDWLQLATGARLKVPMVAKVTLSSAYLWKVGSVSEAVDEVHGFLIDVFGSHIMLQAAQIDLCVDLVGLGLPKEWEEVFISQKLAAGRSPLDVQRQMGHTMLHMTNRCASLTTQQLQRSHKEYSPLRIKRDEENREAGNGYWDE